MKILLVGAGDIGRRVIGLTAGRHQVTAVTSTRSHRAALRRLGAQAVVADLDRRQSLNRLAGDWDVLIHCAPPPALGHRDLRTRNLLHALCRDPRAWRGKLRAIVYLSTTGVYGDCAGARVTEARPVNPRNPRARRRVDAERTLARAARLRGARLAILRVPGIYSAVRLPLDRLRAGTPAILRAEDSYTNHIHADDLAAITVRAMQRTLRRRPAQVRVYHASDDSELRMGDYFDLVASAFGLPAPPRLARADIAGAVSPMLLSFMRESRRLDNTRMKRELRVRLHFPTVADGLAAAVSAIGAGVRNMA